MPVDEHRTRMGAMCSVITLLAKLARLPLSVQQRVLCSRSKTVFPHCHYCNLHAATRRLPPDVPSQPCSSPVCKVHYLSTRPRVGQVDVAAHNVHCDVCDVDVYRQRKDVNTIDGANEGRCVFVVIAAVVGQLSVEQHDFFFVINAGRRTTGRETNCL